MEKVAALRLLLGAFATLLTLSPAWSQWRRPATTPAKRPAVVVTKEYPQARAGRPAVVVNPPAVAGVGLVRPLRLIEMGFRVAPGFSFNSAQGVGAYSQFQPNGVGMRFSIGPTIDYFFFGDRYAFSSGLWYTIKRSSFVVPASFGQDRFRPGQAPGESVYNLQYLQIPLSVKLFANEIAPSVRGYVQCGGLVDVKLAEKPLDQTTNPLYKYATQGGGYQRQYGFMDLSILLGAGIQYRINNVNAVNMGLSYQRGVVNVVRDDALDSRNNTIAIDLGFKF